MLSVSSDIPMRFWRSHRLNPIKNRVLLKKLSCEYPASLREVAYDSRIELKGPSIEHSDIFLCQCSTGQTERRLPLKSLSEDYAEPSTL